MLSFCSILFWDSLRIFAYSHLCGHDHNLGHNVLCVVIDLGLLLKPGVCLSRYTTKIIIAHITKPVGSQ